MAKSMSRSGGTATSQNAPPKSTQSSRSKNQELESFLYDNNPPSGGEGLNELDKYMAEPLLKQSHIDVLAHWKNNAEKYPVLSQIARDVMAVQVSTVASESAFSAGGRVVDPFRSRLDPDMVQALICTKDWVAAARKDKKNVSSFVTDLELIEAMEFMQQQEGEEKEKEKEEEEEDSESESESDPDVMEDEP